MNEFTRKKIQTPLIHHYLMENSYEYKNLYRDDNYVEELEGKAREYYHVRVIDKIEDIGNKINLIRTFIDVMK